MSLPEPRPGLVINYRYLWWHEARAREESGRKPRPCALLIAVDRRRHEHSEPDDPPWVAVVPITTKAPTLGEAAFELPASVKRSLRLDAARSWVMLTEVNTFAWPGVDLEPLPNGRWDYGRLPTALTLELATRLRALAKAEQIHAVDRSE